MGNPRNEQILFYNDGITESMACFQDGPWFSRYFFYRIYFTVFTYVCENILRLISAMK